MLPWRMVLVSPLKSLQARLTVAVLLVFVGSLWLFSSWMGSVMRSEEQRMLRQQQRAEVAMLATQVDAALDVRFRALEKVAFELGRRRHSPGDSDLALLQERPVLQTLFNADVFTLDAEGRLRARWPLLSSAQEFGTYAQTRSAPTSRDVQVVFEQKQWWVWLSVPVVSVEGVPQGQLVGREHLEGESFLQSTLQGNHIMAGAVALMQPDGLRLVLASVENSTGGSPVSFGDVDDMIHDTEFADMRTDAQGQQWLISTHPTQSAPWVVSARTSAGKVFAGVYARQGQMLVATLYLTLLAGGLIWWVIRFHLAPMKHAISSLAAQAAADQPSALRLSTDRKDEVGVLIAGFNQVLDSVDRHAQALQQSERRLADILDHIDSYVYLKDRQGRYLFANRSLCQALGRPLEAIVGHDDRAFFDLAISSQLRANDSVVFATGNVLRVDETLPGTSGATEVTFLTVKLPMRNTHGEIEALCGISTDITQRKRLETDLRIAATAFECQEGIVVLAADLTVMRVNSAFCRLTGYDSINAALQVQAFLRSQEPGASLLKEIWESVAATAEWRGALRISRADGRDIVTKLTVSAVLDAQSRYTHYVVHFMDDTAAQLQEQQRLQQEAAHRIALVREVHHRIKNNLQGILALLRQFAQNNPALSRPMLEAIGQVQAISTIHGLQGKSPSAQMRLCELVDAISDEVSTVWQRPIRVLRTLPWQPWWLAEMEAVPVALIVHELLLNAVKHSAASTREVELRLRRSESGTGLELWLRNPGIWPQAQSQSLVQGSGLGLIDALMPRYGAVLQHKQEGGMVCAVLYLNRPIIAPETEGSLEA
ncbi:MAG: PAS domain-containing protein [Rhodoferax sp.]|nr:MAG: PAS domain-containing protein [Rhodoferax sp.]